MLLKQFIEAERAKPMSVKDVMALSYRKGLRSVDYDDLKGKTLKQILVGPESGVLVFFKDHRPGRDVGHFCFGDAADRNGESGAAAGAEGGTLGLCRKDENVIAHIGAEALR